MIVIRSRSEMLDWRRQQDRSQRRIGFVPTMGALHAGHLSLLTKARETCDTIAASIFVNPTQFGPAEDYGIYPRTEASDLAALEAAGCNAVYCPEPQAIYPDGDETRVRVPGLSRSLEGEFREGFFEGVASVVTRLFAQVRPHVAVFGEKDFQQLMVIRRLTQDLGFDIRIESGPTLREADGLAMSSRNRFLSGEDRLRASSLYRELDNCRAALEGGEVVDNVVRRAVDNLLSAGFHRVDYLAACSAETFEPLTGAAAAAPGDGGRILAAARLSGVRLIDNLAFERPRG